MDLDEQHEPISKTRRKRQMLALQDLGEELVRLNAEQLARLELPESLRDAIEQAKGIRQFGALRRQLQYIGRLMREVDAAAIAARVAAWRGAARRPVAYLHRLERWRERLLELDEALGELAQAHPGGDLERVRALVQEARRERASGRPPAAARALFQALRDIVPFADIARDDEPGPASAAGSERS